MLEAKNEEVDMWVSIINKDFVPRELEKTVSDDLVKRLRKRQEYEFIDEYKRIEWEDADALEAADRIEELEEKLAWQPIDTAPTDRTMFVVIGVILGTGNGLTGGKKYTTDPVCVWRDEDGAFARWQHIWPPTHWMPLPTAPIIKGAQP